MFAAMDAALGSLTPARLSALHDEAEGAAKQRLGRYLENPTLDHSRWLVGRVVFTGLAAVLVANQLAPYVPHWTLAPVGALGALLTYGTLAEIGTTLGRTRAHAFALRLLPLVRPLEWLLWPLAAPLSLLGRLTSKGLAPKTDAEEHVADTEVEWAVAEGQKQGSLGPEPAEMIRNVLELKDLVARDVMVPRTRVSAIDADTPVADVLKFVASEGHSRYPVYRDKIDNILGLLYAKDLFRQLQDDKPKSTPLADLIRGPVNFVPEMQGVSSVLREMRARRLHMAVVIDEFGGFSGIVTLEDILEVIVGEIRDEYDTEEAPIQDLGDGRVLADAAVSVHDLSAYLGVELPESPDYESLGGLLIHQAGKVPSVGSQIEAFGLLFVVRDADEKRIAKVEILRAGAVSEEMAAEGRASEAATKSEVIRPPRAEPGETEEPPGSNRKIASAPT
jgi:CBS domain containing-hemolysin-like protein